MNEQELEQSLTATLETTDIQVHDVESCERAGAAALKIKAMEKVVIDFFREIKADAAKLHKGICAKEKKHLAPLSEARGNLTKGISLFLTKQAQIEREKQEKLDKQRAADEEKKRQSLEKRAAKAEEKGQDIKAENLRDEIDDVHLPVEIAEPAIKQVKVVNGTVSRRSQTVVDVVDVKLICAEIAAGRAPVGLVEFKKSELQKFVKSFGHKKFPGLRIQEKFGATFRD